MLNFFKTAKIKTRFKNTPNPFTDFFQIGKNGKHFIYYDEADGLDIWVNGIIKKSEKFAFVSADLLYQAYKPNNISLQLKEELAIALLSNEFLISQTYLLGRFNIYREGFEKEVWLSVWESVADSHRSAFFKTQDTFTSAMPDSEVKEKMMKRQPEIPYKNYMASSLEKLCEGEIKNTPIEVLQNKLLKHYDYSPKKEAELKELIKNISFSILSGQIPLYCWE
jgi:hypothetical protein